MQAPARRRRHPPTNTSVLGPRASRCGAPLEPPTIRSPTAVMGLARPPLSLEITGSKLARGGRTARVGRDNVYVLTPGDPALQLPVESATNGWLRTLPLVSDAYTLT